MLLGRLKLFKLRHWQMLSVVTELTDGTRSSSNTPSQTTCNGNCYALHWAVPIDWNSKTTATQLGSWQHSTQTQQWA
jgi:hypothetical protein